MAKIPTAEELATIMQNDLPYEDVVDTVRFASLVAIEFAKLHVKAALETALEDVPYGGSDEVRYEDVVGILTCYPLENIT